MFCHWFSSPFPSFDCCNASFNVDFQKDSVRGRSKWLKKLGTSKGRLVWGSCSKREVLESNANWMEVRMLMAQLNMIQDTFGQCCSGVFTF